MKHILIAALLLSACKSSSSTPTTTPKTDTAQRLALGDVTLTMEMKHGPDTAKAEITIAPDGTMTAVVDGTQKKQARVTAAGEFFDDKGRQIGKLDDNGTAFASFETTDMQDGKVVKTDTKWNELGKFEADGSFTGAKEGVKLSVGDDGKVVGLPPEVTVTVKAAPAQRKLALFVVLASMAGGRATVESSGATAPAVQPTK